MRWVGRSGRPVRDTVCVGSATLGAPAPIVADLTVGACVHRAGMTSAP